MVKLVTEQLSIAVGAVHDTVAAQEPVVAFVVMLEGVPVMVGLVTSLTVTVKLLVEVLLFTSVAVYVTVVIPIGKVLPLVCEPVNVAIAQLSLAVGAVHVAVAPHELDEAFNVILLGVPLIAGFMLSTTTILKVEVLTLLEASVAV